MNPGVSRRRRWRGSRCREPESCRGTSCIRSTSCKRSRRSSVPSVTCRSLPCGSPGSERSPTVGRRFFIAAASLASRFAGSSPNDLRLSIPLLMKSALALAPSGVGTCKRNPGTGDVAAVAAVDQRPRQLRSVGYRPLYREVRGRWQQPPDGDCQALSATSQPGRACLCPARVALWAEPEASSAFDKRASAFYLRQWEARRRPSWRAWHS